MRTRSESFDQRDRVGTRTDAGVPRVWREMGGDPAIQDARHLRDARERLARLLEAQGVEVGVYPDEAFQGALDAENCVRAWMKVMVGRRYLRIRVELADADD